MQDRMFKCSQAQTRQFLFNQDPHTLDLMGKPNQEAIKVSHFIGADTKVGIKAKIMSPDKDIAHNKDLDQEMEPVLIIKAKIMGMSKDMLHNKDMVQAKGQFLIKGKAMLPAKDKVKDRDIIQVSLGKFRAKELGKVTVQGRVMGKAKVMVQDKAMGQVKAMDQVKVMDRVKAMDKGRVMGQG